jgi:hypothetical protein
MKEDLFPTNPQQRSPASRAILRPVYWSSLTAAIVAMLLVALHLARASYSVNLAWDANSEPDLARYKVYWGLQSGTPTESLDAGKLTTATVANLDAGTTYFFTVTAINEALLESGPSNEVSYTTPSQSAELYSLTVVRGSGSGRYSAGIWVPVHAETPGRGEQFAHWDGDTQILKSPRTDEDNEAFTISRDVTITAIYSALPSFTVTVTSGTGDGSYYTGAQVNIYADPAPAGQEFAGWTGNITFDDESSPTTSFTMPSSPVVVTATYSVSSGGTGTGLRGEYYNDPNNGAYPLEDPFTDSPVLTRTDSTVNFNWGNDSPGSQVSSDYFSVKWTGQVRAPVSGTYTFTVTGDDGVRLYLNGQLVNDGWADQDPTSYSYTTTLTAGTLYNIELHYYEHGGDASCRLSWSYPGQSTQTIPSGELYPSSADVIATATYGVEDEIRYYPRVGFLSRMIGGVFEGTNDDPLTGTYTRIYAITTTPPLAWTTINANLGNYRYLRYRGPNGSYGNIAEIEFYRNGMKIHGTAYGTSGSWNKGNTFEKALDGDINTYFDGPTANGNYVGIDRGAP